MKEGWEYKKLGEIVSFISDGDWIESRYQSDNGIRLIQTGNIGNGIFKAKEDKPHYISEGTFQELNCTEIYENDCLVSRLPDPIGRSCIIPDIGNRMITAVDCTILRFNADFLTNFFVYYTLSSTYSKLISKKTTGSTRKRISRKNLESIIIPVPPLSEQKRIVEELDLLSSIIEKQKQQLKELDTLAQSIFYDMFGDPVTNEKGWEVRPFKDLFKLQSGDGLRAKDFISGEYPVYGGNGISGYHNEYNKTDKHIIIGRVGVYCGNVRYVEGKFWLTDNAFDTTFDKKKWDYVFVRALLNSINLHQYANHAAQPVISNLGLKNVPVILPSLHLQNLFASKIEAIEKQKEAITKSIEETQKLFDYTMDKYFG